MIVQSIKQFLKPDWKKILLAILLYLIIVFIIARNIVCIAMAGVSCGGYWDTFIVFSPLIIILYLVSCTATLILVKGLITTEKIIFFFKPTKNKFLVFVLLFSFFLIFFGDPYRMALCSPCGCSHRWGYPLTFVQEIMEKPKILDNYNLLSDHSFCGPRYKSYNYLNLFYDIIFWYFVSCLVIFVSGKIKSKK